MTIEQHSKSYMDEYLGKLPGPRHLPSNLDTDSFAIETDERPWGRWSLLHEGPGYKVKLIEVHPGRRLSLQYHHHRSELWTCVGGVASALVGERLLELKPRESVRIGLGEVHRLGNAGHEPVFIVEVQQGEILREDDIVRLEDDYQRAGTTR